VIAVLVVNWNDEAASIRALRSVPATEKVLPVLVDNGSDVDPTEAVRDASVGARIERLKANRGYGAACNHGVAVAEKFGATHVLLMNNDAELEPGALDQLVAADRDFPGCLLAPVIVYSDMPDRVWSAGGYLEPPYLQNHHIGLGDSLDAHRLRRRVEWATGCALWFSVETWRRIGPLDEAFFLYLEDVDWCLRAARVGVETWLVPEAIVRHEVSRTTRELSSETLRYYAYRNHFRLAFRHSRGWRRGAVAFEFAWTVAKISLRSLFHSSYRHDSWYHARTLALRDVALGRWGPAPERVKGAAA
jgi:GT2 family glycosyltransferase